MPYGIDPQTIQKLLFGGAPSAMFGADPTASPSPQAPAAAPQGPAPMPGAQPPGDTPPRGSIASAMPQQQTPPSSPGYSSTPQSFDEYHASHGDVPISAPPPVIKHGGLAKAMLGIGEFFGNPLATRIGDRDRTLQQENQQFEQNKPAIQYTANRGAYEQDLGNLQKVAETRRANIDADVAQQNLPLQQAAEKHYHDLEDAWVNKSVPPEQFDNYAQIQLQAMPAPIARMVAPHLQSIKGLQQTGKGYKVNLQDDMPVSIEAYGRVFQRDKDGKFPPGVPPQAVQEFQAAQTTHGKAQQGKVDVARAEGQARAEVEANAARGSNAALASVPPHLIGPATDAATKAGTEYAHAQAVSQRLQAMMDAARSGNVVSYQLIPEEGALQVVTSQGIHRINMAEIQNYGGGSIFQQLEGHLGKALTGKSIPDSVLKDMEQIQKIQNEGARAQYQNTLRTVNQNFGSNFQPLDMGSQDGPTATGPNGHKIKVVGGKWVDAATGKPI